MQGYEIGWIGPDSVILSLDGVLEELVPFNVEVNYGQDTRGRNTAAGRAQPQQTGRAAQPQQQNGRFAQPQTQQTGRAAQQQRPVGMGEMPGGMGGMGGMGAMGGMGGRGGGR